MSESAASNPETPSGSGATNTIAAAVAAAVIIEPIASASVITNNRVFVIESSYKYRDIDNYDASREEVLVDEGWFADEASAEIRRDQLNAGSRTLYDQTVITAKRAQAEKIGRARKFNREAAVLRAAGLAKTDIAIPPAYTPPTYEQFLRNTNHTVHTVVEVSRADHDGIAQAIAAQAAEAPRGDRA